MGSLSYPLIAIIKLLGLNYTSVDFVSYRNKNIIDIYTKIILKYDKEIATGNVGIGVKKEGELIISGTKGNIYVPSPWWKTEYFEVRFEDQNKNQKFFIKFEEDGLRYELAEFLNSINNHIPNISLNQSERIAISKLIEEFNNKEKE